MITEKTNKHEPIAYSLDYREHTCRLIEFQVIKVIKIFTEVLCYTLEARRIENYINPAYLRSD